MLKKQKKNHFNISYLNYVSFLNIVRIFKSHFVQIKCCSIISCFSIFYRVFLFSFVTFIVNFYFVIFIVKCQLPKTHACTSCFLLPSSHASTCILPPYACTPSSHLHGLIIPSPLTVWTHTTPSPYAWLSLQLDRKSVV